MMVVRLFKQNTMQVLVIEKLGHLVLGLKEQI
jgi:hypothetical protein